ncbi:alpha/beta fold hydrolase [Streptomyces sp. NPDC021098]|uniref:alpha/beta fold hydrolase n=1 Tax=unclassified Streptomyces TaxID=2593676 RepID=UPI0037A83260
MDLESRTRSGRGPSRTHRHHRGEPLPARSGGSLRRCQGQRAGQRTRARGPGAVPGIPVVKREVAETPAEFPSLDAARAYWRGIRPGITTEALESRIRHTLRPGVCGRWSWKFDLAGIAAARLDTDPARQVDLWPSVEALRCPTLVVRGGASDFLPAATAAEMTARNPRVRTVEMPGAGHYVHDDAPDAFHHHLELFLSRPEAAT